MTTSRSTLLFTLVALCVCLGIGSAGAGSVLVPISAATVSTYSLEESQPVYVLGITLPGEIAGKRLDGAFLEFYVDASLLESAEFEHVPSIDVGALNEAYAGSGEPATDRGSSRAVALGSGRRVRVDITDIVKGWIANPESNRGLVVGALTGSRVGSFALRDDVLGGSAVATVTFIFQHRFGERVSSRQ
jgi:hypothetical protein